MKISTLDTFDTEYSADSVEFCPCPNYHDYFACGTYQLQQNDENEASKESSVPCKRKGRLYLFKVNQQLKKLQHLQSLETAAILDMKWLNEKHWHNSDRNEPILATANALGQVEIYELRDEHLMLCTTHALDKKETSTLALSLDWSMYSENHRQRNLIVSDSSGSISLLNFNVELKQLTLTHKWNAHSFEAWICTFDKWNSNTIYTGGDDTFLHAYDLRSFERHLTNMSHMAGVTCLLSHPTQPNILLTGSYDENVRIFDTRSMRKPLDDLNLKGGIWRLKSDPLNNDLVLVACMYHNFSIVNLNMNSTSLLKLVGVYEEHESICYGSDWCHGIQEDGMLIATCSFYDHKLCLSCVNLDQPVQSTY